MKRKAQMNMIIIVLMLVVFAGIGLFLLSITQGINQNEYLNLYVNNLLLSMMRTDTGYLDSNCKLLSDTLACAYISPGIRCGGSGPTCNDLAEQKIAEYMSEFEQARDFNYLLKVEPKGFTTIAEGEVYSITFGDPALDTLRGERFVSTGTIQRDSSTGQNILSVKLIISKK